MSAQRVQAKTADRGYGSRHQAQRRKWARVVASGRAACVRCGRLIVPGTPWDLDHGDVKVDGEYLGPAHAKCNRSAGARARDGKASGFRWSRSW